MRSFVAVSLFAILTGCYTQQGLESREPLSVLEVAADPETLAQCIPRHLDIVISSLVTRTDDDSAIILTSLENEHHTFYWQARIFPIAGGHSRIDIRSAYYIQGPFFDQSHFDAIAACGEIISREDFD